MRVECSNWGARGSRGGDAGVHGQFRRRSAGPEDDVGIPHRRTGTWAP